MNMPEPVTTEALTTEHLSSYDATPAAALEALLQHDGPVLLDLDETLYLRNSTEDFLDSARPAVAALLLLRLLDFIGPWRWTGGEATRDSWRVATVAIMLPWSLPLWRARCDSLAGQHRNRSLLAAVQTHGVTPTVATIGFLPIVRPLVAALGLPQARIVASRLFHFGDRREGKLARTTAALGGTAVAQALVITDSEQDLPLLSVCAKPLRTVWPEARYRPALSDVYLPGQYLSRVKHPNQRYILRGILQEEFALWVLSSLALAASPVNHVLGLGLLLVSFWAIYERGYVDNDLVAAKYEDKPKLSAAFHVAPVATPRWQPWIWAIACGAAGAWVLRWPDPPSAEDLGRWGLVLLATHGWFDIYNRYDKATRVWLYVGLQTARTTAFMALVPVLPVGAAALAAHIFARWLPYYVYRGGSGGSGGWPEAPLKLLRLMLFLVFIVVLAGTQGLAPLLGWSAAALLGWNLYRAYPELRRHWAAAKRLDRSAPRRVP